MLGYDVVHEIEDTRVHSVGPSAIGALKGGIPEPFFMTITPIPCSPTATRASKDAYLARGWDKRR